MAACQLCWPPAILFYRCSLDLLSSLFSPPNLRGRLVDRHQTLPHVRRWPRFNKIRSEIWVAPSPAPEIWLHKNIKISVRFRTTSRLDREYLRNTTRHRQSENGVANYGHFRTGKLKLVYFGQQTAKNRTGVLTYPTGDHQAWHCHASIVWLILHFLPRLPIPRSLSCHFTPTVPLHVSCQIYPQFPLPKKKQLNFLHQNIDMVKFADFCLRSIANNIAIYYIYSIYSTLALSRLFLICITTTMFMVLSS